MYYNLLQNWQKPFTVAIYLLQTSPAFFADSVN